MAVDALVTSATPALAGGLLRRRWAAVSDIHGNLPALEAVIADAPGVDGWLNLGDIVSGPLWPRETAALPPQLAPADGPLCVHGTPTGDLQYLLETVTPAALREAGDAEVQERLGGTQVALLLCGHTHLPRDRQLGTMRLANPGSVGLPAYDDKHPWPHAAETGSPQARCAVVDHDGSGRVGRREVS
ncbi:MAG: metallophosphoesterase family protein [Rubrivivax sp.]